MTRGLKQYVKPDKEWMKTEIKLMDRMGEKWFEKNPPKIWEIPRTPERLWVRVLKKKLRDIGFIFQSCVLVLNRYFRDLFCSKRKIVIHHKKLGRNEQKLYRQMNIKFFHLKESGGEREIERIVGEVSQYENKSVDG